MQRIAQSKQVVYPVRRFFHSGKYSRWPSSQWTSCQLWVGHRYASFTFGGISRVPISWKYPLRSVLFAIVFLWNTFAGCPCRPGKSIVPKTVTALSFFEPRTAPRPPRAAIRSSSATPATRTRFSPAGPIVRARPSFLSASRVSSVSRPQSFLASWSVAFPFRISSRAGPSEAPTMRTTSKPAFRRVGPQNPPAAAHE